MEFPAGPGETALSYMRPTRPVYRGTSLAAAFEALRESNADVVPVLDGPRLAGVLWSARLREAAFAGVAGSESIDGLLDDSPPTIAPNTRGSEVVSLLRDSGKAAAIVVDAEQRYLGTVSALDLFHRPQSYVRPPFVGGMATPLGVFLTNGEVSGGVGPFALVLTGALLFGLLMLSFLGTYVLLHWVGALLSASAYSFLYVALPPALFFCLLRVIPLSGTHGAEHMVVHAIERREPLLMDVVRRMPRVHPRCGTNFAIGAMLFTTLVGTLWPYLREAGALIALVFTLLFWRPLGALFQQYVTTKPPTKKQLKGAIAAGEELLANFRNSARPLPSFLRRLAMSGLPYVLLGSFFAYAIAWGLLWFLRIDPIVLGLG